MSKQQKVELSLNC